jgi:hypothetical protein
MRVDTAGKQCEGVHRLYAMRRGDLEGLAPAAYKGAALLVRVWSATPGEAVQMGGWSASPLCDAGRDSKGLVPAAHKGVAAAGDKQRSGGVGRATDERHIERGAPRRKKDGCA